MSETSLDKRPEALSKNDLNTAGADKRSKAQSHPVPQIPSMCPLLVVILAMGTLNFIIHLVVLPQMPDMLPMHWGIDGTADDYTSKYEELWLCLVPFLSVLMLFVPRFDPKGEAYTKVWRFFQVLLLVLTLFFCAMTWLPELSVIGIIPQDDNLMGAVILLMVGLLLIFVGNYIPRVRQNYSMGIKTPWALADEYTWQRSQRMGGHGSGVYADRCHLALYTSTPWKRHPLHHPHGGTLCGNTLDVCVFLPGLQGYHALGIAAVTLLRPHKAQVTTMLLPASQPCRTMLQYFLCCTGIRGPHSGIQ